MIEQIIFKDYFLLDLGSTMGIGIVVLGWLDLRIKTLLRGWVNK